MKDLQESGRSNYAAFLVWPFGALLAAIFNYKVASSRNIVWLFTIFYGFTFVVSNESSDANRYIEWFYEYRDYGFNMSAFSSILYSEETQVLDVFVPFLSFLVANVIGDHRFYLAALGCIFGYLYSRNIWFIVDRIGNKMSWELLLLIVVFALLFPIWRGINGPRFAIAANLFFFGAIRYVYNQERSGLFYALLSPFVHFSCILAVPVLLLYFLFRRSIHLVFLFFVITMFLSEIDLNFVRDALDFLPDVFQKRVDDYTNEEYKVMVEGYVSAVNWYVKAYNKSLTWAIFAMVILLYSFARRFIVSNKQIYQLAVFSILFLSIANLASLVPSGGRFQTAAFMFIIALYAFFVSQSDIRNGLVSGFHYLLIPIFLLYILVQVRIGFDSIGLMTVIGNPLLSLFSDYDIPLIDLIK